MGAAATPDAHTLVRDGERVDGYRRHAAALFTGIDALALPTVPFQPTLAQVAADALGVNRELGSFTNFVNLLDLSAIAVPAGDCDGGLFGITLIASAFVDRVLADLAADFLSEPRPRTATPGVPVFVVGAHRHGQPLNRELSGPRARCLETLTTAACYRLHALDTVPPKPGLVRTARDGAEIEGELWAVPPLPWGRFSRSSPRRWRSARCSSPTDAPWSASPARPPRWPEHPTSRATGPGRRAETPRRRERVRASMLGGGPRAASRRDRPRSVPRRRSATDRRFATAASGWRRARTAERGLTPTVFDVPRQATPGSKLQGSAAYDARNQSTFLANTYRRSAHRVGLEWFQEGTYAGRPE